MKKNQLGTSDIYLSALTLGCMSLGTDKQAAADMIKQAIEQGVNHLDTADLYDFGYNEEMIGEITKDFRQEIILTSKGGNHFNKETKDWFWDPSKEYIEEALKNSLKRLQTDYLDFYMLHGGTIDDPIDETIEALENLKKAGWIRAYGISSIRPNVIKQFANHSNIDGVMTQYSMLDRRAEEEILPLLKEKGISVIARGPLAHGMLSHASDKQVEKKAENGYLNYSKTELQATLTKLKAFKGQIGSLNELALKFVLNHPAITTAVFGASTVEQVKENTLINVNTPLPEDMKTELLEITKANQYEQHR